MMWGVTRMHLCYNHHHAKHRDEFFLFTVESIEPLTVYLFSSDITVAKYGICALSAVHCTVIQPDTAH